MWRPVPVQSTSVAGNYRTEGLKLDGLEVNGLAITCKSLHRPVARSKSLTTSSRERDAVDRKACTATERYPARCLVAISGSNTVCSASSRRSEEEANEAEKSFAACNQPNAEPNSALQDRDKRMGFPSLKRGGSFEKDNGLICKSSKNALMRLKEDPVPPTNVIARNFEHAGAQQIIRMKKFHTLHFRGDLSKKQGASLILVGGNKSVKVEANSRGIKVLQQQDDSNLFDVKWTLGHADIDFCKLSAFQFVNHFPCTASELGAKVGLNRNLKSLGWFDGVEVDGFFPRMYNLSNPWELQDFIEDFVFTAAAVEIKREMLGLDLTDPAAKNSDERRIDILESASLVCERFLDNKKKLVQGDKDGNIAGVLGIHHYLWIRLDLPWKSFSISRTKELEPPHLWRAWSPESVRQKVADVFSRLKAEHVQFGMDGVRNVWLVKPGCGTRGNGIKCFDNIRELLCYAAGRRKGAIAQKYIENCLLLHGKKFDIRSWTLVSNWNPLTAWLHEPYMRICTERHSLDADGLKNQFKHLCNR